jgi:uncharacterized RDD family membrane protein YckC
MIGDPVNVMTIKTPEGVAFALPLASPLTRMLAWGVDFLAIIVIGMAFSVALSFLFLINPDLAMALRIVGWFAISIGYGVAMEWYWRGQTLGKRLLRLRVVDAQGLHLQFHQIFMRNLLRFVDSLPVCYLVGGIVCALNRRCQRLGDIAAGTVVIHLPRLAEPDLEQILSGKFNSLRRHPHLVGRLRQRVSPAEAAIALQAVLRREEFSPAERVELFAELARHFKNVAHFPADATDGITDEQYLRNVVEVLYRTESRSRAKEPAAPAAATANSTP